MAVGDVRLGYMYAPEFIRGRPIFGGFVYIGNINTDPTNPANQKPITLRHSGGDTVIAQPAELGAGGVCSYQGSPARILVDGNYSMTIHDREGAEIYYIPDIAPFPLDFGDGGGGGTGECCERYGNITVTVGAGGDYSSLDAALTALSNTGKKHDPGSSVVVNILASTVIPSNITIDSVDLSWIEIQSDDATVTVSSAGLTGGKGFWVVQNGADSPTIGTVFVSDVSGAGGYAGLYVDGAGSTAGILATKGFQEFASSVVAIDGAVVDAKAATTTGATGDAFAVTDGGVINATGASGTHSQAANILYPEGIIYHDSGPPDYMPVEHHVDAATALAASIADGGVALHVSPGEHVDDEYTIGQNANGYYRIRNADGYIEQWGSVTDAGNTFVALTFPVAMSDTDYAFTSQFAHTVSTSDNCYAQWQKGSRTTTGLGVSVQAGNQTDWSIRGY